MPQVCTYLLLCILTLGVTYSQQIDDDDDGSVVALATDLIGQRQWSEAESLLKQAFNRAHAADPLSHASIVLGNELGRLFQDLGRNDEAEQYYLTTLRAVKANGSLMELIVLNSNLACVYLETGEYGKAERLHLERLLPQAVNTPEAAKIRGSLGTLAYFRGRKAEAEALLLSALEDYRAEGLETDAAITLSNLGLVSAQARRFDTAVDRIQTGIRLLEQGPNRDNIVMFKSLTNLGVVYVLQNKKSEARASIQKALALFEQMGAPENSSTAAILTQCGGVLKRLGEKHLAKNTLKRADTIARSTQVRERQRSTVDVSDLLARRR